MFLVRCSWRTGEGICLNLVCWLFRPPVSSLWWARLFVQARFGHGWPLLPDAAPLRSHARDGARTRKRESHLERICHQPPFISSSGTEKIQRTQTARIFQTPSSRQNYWEKKNLPQPQTYLKKKQQKNTDKADCENNLAAFQSSGG